MKVRVKSPGFINRLWEVGSIIDVEEDQFSERWMERLEEKPKRGRPKKVVEETKEP